jgi:hypothetical protein
VNEKDCASTPSTNQIFIAIKAPVANTPPTSAATNASIKNGSRIENLDAPTKRMIPTSRRLANAASRIVFETNITVTTNMVAANPSATTCKPESVTKSLSKVSR